MKNARTRFTYRTADYGKAKTDRKQHTEMIFFSAQKESHGLLYVIRSARFPP